MFAQSLRVAGLDELAQFIGFSARRCDEAIEQRISNYQSSIVIMTRCFQQGTFPLDFWAHSVSKIYQIITGSIEICGDLLDKIW